MATKSSAGGADEDRREHAEYLHSLGERVRRRRAVCNYSRRQLSQMSGVSERFIAHLELGQGNISVLRLKSIADALEMPLTEIIDDAREPVGRVNGDAPEPAVIADLFREADPSFQKAVVDLLMSAARRTHAA